MDAQQYERVQAAFLRIRETGSAEQEKELAGLEESIRREVESLLAADRCDESFLTPPAFPVVGDAGDSPTTRSESSNLPLQRIGSYRLLQKIGEGGFGSVYMAEQTEPVHRKVAVKLIKPGMDSKQLLARFQAERQALAMMEHTSIARFFDVGTTPSGLPCIL